MEHNYFLNNNSQLSEYTEEIIAYMSGYVARSVRNKINCSICKSLLLNVSQRQSDTYRISKLLQRKKQGQLFEASHDVIIICKITYILKCLKYLITKRIMLFIYVLHLSNVCLYVYHFFFCSYFLFIFYMFNILDILMLLS